MRGKDASLIGTISPDLEKLQRSGVQLSERLASVIFPLVSTPLLLPSNSSIFPLYFPSLSLPYVHESWGQSLSSSDCKTFAKSFI